MERIRLPDPTFSFQAAGAAPLNVPWKIDCFPLADRKVVCADQLGRTFFFDATTRRVGTMPDLHRPKCSPFAVFVPDADADDDLERDGGSSLYVMERAPKLELGTGAPESEQFEAFLYRWPITSTFTKSWDCQLLPPPPFVREARDSGHRCPEITSYAVVGGGSKVCISADDGAGTYCLDTARHTWRQVGRWTLPFHGKVEYVPELKLWFGLSGADGAQLVAAADLSDMDSEPQLVGAWRELDPPEEWKECKESQLVNLGSGKFCVARLFRTLNGVFGDELVDQNFTVFTGVEVVPQVHDASANGNGNGKVGLRMIPHKSKWYTSDNGSNIESVF
ncbi:hypothetical protein ACP70R_004730 [Stipagrostis hirtigluma subsp. patula]